MDQTLKSFWKDSGLSKDDKFLRDYIMGEKWKETNNDFDANIDLEDERREEEADKFEHAYNFRFEEAGGNEIQTHSRTVEDSMRLKTNKRAEKRKEVSERKRKEKEGF